MVGRGAGVNSSLEFQGFRMRRRPVNREIAVLTNRLTGSDYFFASWATKHLAHCYFVLPPLTQKRWVLLRRNNSLSATTGEATNI